MGKWRARGSRGKKNTHSRTIWKHVERAVRRQAVDRDTAFVREAEAEARAERDDPIGTAQVRAAEAAARAVARADLELLKSQPKSEPASSSVSASKVEPKIQFRDYSPTPDFSEGSESESDTPLLKAKEETAKEEPKIEFEFRGVKHSQLTPTLVSQWLIDHSILQQQPQERCTTEGKPMGVN